MAFTYAGQYTEVILGTSSAGFAVALPSLSVHVYTVGTTTHPTLYTSRTKGTTTANPTTTDVNGNLTFFVDPGQYDIVFTPPGGSQKRVTVTVPADPAESSAAYASLRKETLRRFPKVNTVLPAEMTTPPVFALSGPGGTSPIAGGSPQLIAYNSAQVKLRGAVPTLVSQFSINYFANGVNAGWTPPPMWPTFDYYGSDLALRFRPRTSNANDQKVWVWVDSVPATPAPVPLGTLSGGSQYRYRLTFSEGVALRRISIWTDLMDFGGLDLGPTDTVAYPTVSDEKVALYGDSWIEGTTGVDNIDVWAEQLPWYLGMEGYKVGQGGTGYVHNPGGGKAAYTDSTRLAQLVATGADWVIVFGSINDDPEAGVQAAATTVYAAIAAGLPNAKVIVVGPPGTSGSPTTNRLANRTAVAAAAAAASNVIAFIDPVASGWITGTGHVGGTVGDGTADVLIASDGAHLADADAHAYWRSRVRSAIAAVLAA